MNKNFEKDKRYCYKCFSEIKYDEQLKEFVITCDCKKFYTIKWCETCGDFTNHKGFGDYCTCCLLSKAWENDVERKEAQSKRTLELNKKLWSDTEYINNMTDAMTKRWEDEDFKDKMIENNKTRWDDPDFRSKMIPKMIEMSNKAWSDPKMMEIVKENIKMVNKKQWVDPIYKEKMRIANVKWMTELWEDEDFKTKHSERLIENWKDPEYRENMTRIITEYSNDPIIIKQRSELFIRLWEEKVKNLETILLPLMSTESSIKISDILNKNFNSMSGVWSLWGINKETKIRECLTVGQTIDLGEELNWSIRVLANEELQELETKEPGSTGRWNKIQLFYNNYEFTIVSQDSNSFEQRELIEMSYAIQNSSIYWLPSITQLNINLTEVTIK